MHRQASKKETQKHHDRSLDDFLKHLKKYNLKTERHDRILSPDPLAPYRQNTTHTLQRSRTLSGKQSRKTNRTTRQKVQKILSRSKSKDKSKLNASNIISKSQSGGNLPNPADLISEFSKRIREAEQILQGKSKMGTLLCRKFLEMLNEIVENMVLNLQQNLEELEKTIYDRLEREIGDRAEKKANALQKKLSKLQRQTLKLLQKQNFNNNLIYHLRLQNFDVDKAFGQCIFRSDNFGGLGYKHYPQQGQIQSHNSLNHLSNSELIFVKRKAEENEDHLAGRRPDWDSGWEWRQGGNKYGQQDQQD